MARFSGPRPWRAWPRQIAFANARSAPRAVAAQALRGMRAGRYRAAVTLSQAGRNIASVTRSFRIRG